MKIGVLCSGGDAPGMNPALRAIVRAGDKYGDEIVGIKHGYQGLLDEEFWHNDGNSKIDIREVSGLTNKGGAFLNSSRCAGMLSPEGRRRAADTLRKYKFDALIPIGGNGTLTGARDLGEFWKGQIIGLPGTIDNDLLGTDVTIGFATAVHTGVEAIDKLRDTAGSHDMMFLVEVMGRHCGDLAAYTALAGGCEIAVIPEKPTTIPELIAKLERFKSLGKRSMIMVVAEGSPTGGAYETMNALKAAGSPYEMRAVVLGHVQRGGTPAPVDRMIATELGCLAVDAIHNGETGKMAGQIAGKPVLTPFDEVLVGHREATPETLALIERVAV